MATAHLEPDLQTHVPPRAPTPENETKGDKAKSETLEDYTLRFAPRSYRRWAPGVVATSALGGIAYLADFSIGANIGIQHGTTNAILGILVAAAIIFVTGVPLAYYAARYNLDLDLVTRGKGFGYYGSVLTNVIFASFTFIFFALEGSIMAQGLQLGLGVPLWAGYLVSSLMIIPLVVYGMRVLSKLQVWTTPLWLVLMGVPLVYLVSAHPGSVDTFLGYRGAAAGVSFSAVMLAAGVCLSLIGQIAEQIDYLRFMPPKTPENSRRWWAAVIIAGPGWVFFGALKQMIGLFLAVYLIANVADGRAIANEPIHQFLSAYEQMMPGWLAMTLAVVLVVISQIKINVTNAYSGSLAWTNAYTRVTKHYPGRMVFVVVNVLIALVMMEANMFDFLNTILGFYSNLGIAWIVTVATDIVVNTYLLKLSPKETEFRRGMLYAINPVGFVTVIAAGGLSIIAFFGGLGSGLQPFSPIIAVVLSVVLPPVIAVATKGRYYRRRSTDGLELGMFDEHGNPSAVEIDCAACGDVFERPDMLASAAGAGAVCSLCVATDRTRAPPASGGLSAPRRASLASLEGGDGGSDTGPRDNRVRVARRRRPRGAARHDRGRLPHVGGAARAHVAHRGSQSLPATDSRGTRHHGRRAEPVGLGARRRRDVPRGGPDHDEARRCDGCAGARCGRHRHGCGVAAGARHRHRQRCGAAEGCIGATDGRHRHRQRHERAHARRAARLRRPAGGKGSLRGRPVGGAVALRRHCRGRRPAPARIPHPGTGPDADGRHGDVAGRVHRGHARRRLGRAGGHGAGGGLDVDPRRAGRHLGRRAADDLLAAPAHAGAAGLAHRLRSRADCGESRPAEWRSGIRAFDEAGRRALSVR